MIYGFDRKNLCYLNLKSVSCFMNTYTNLVLIGTVTACGRRQALFRYFFSTSHSRVQRQVGKLEKL